MVEFDRGERGGLIEQRRRVNGLDRGEKGGLNELLYVGVWEEAFLTVGRCPSHSVHLGLTIPSRTWGLREGPGEVGGWVGE